MGSQGSRITGQWGHRSTRSQGSEVRLVGDMCLSLPPCSKCWLHLFAESGLVVSNYNWICLSSEFHPFLPHGFELLLWIRNIYVASVLLVTFSLGNVTFRLLVVSSNVYSDIHSQVTFSWGLLSFRTFHTCIFAYLNKFVLISKWDSCNNLWLILIKYKLIISAF